MYIPFGQSIQKNLIFRSVNFYYFYYRPSSVCNQAEFLCNWFYSEIARCQVNFFVKKSMPFQLFIHLSKKSARKQHFSASGRLFLPLAVHCPCPQAVAQSSGSIFL